MILQINVSQRQSCLMDVCTHLSISNRQCCCNYTLCTPATFYPRGLALLTFHMKQNDSKMTEQRPTVRQCANKDSIYLLCPHQCSANTITATRKHCLLSGALQPLSVKASAQALLLKMQLLARTNTHTKQEQVRASVCSEMQGEYLMQKS